MPRWIQRDCAERVVSLARDYPVVTLTGPRQAGKTTLCRMAFGDLPYANLESPDTRGFAAEDPKGFLANYPNGAILDEFQRVPELASYIQVLVDVPDFNGAFVLTGSQNFRVRNMVSQSLAGRTALVELLPFSYQEVTALGGAWKTDELLFQGFYPRVWDQQLSPPRAYADYSGTYIERDLRQLSMVRDLSLFQKFLGLCAGRVGQLLNLESLGNDCGIAQPTARDWLSLLEASYIAFRLPPFFQNVSKRLVKTSKLYFYDVGLAAHLMGITDFGQLPTHPLRGMLFENLCVVEAMKYFLNQCRRPQLHFYRDSNGNEVDLVMPHGAEWIAIEIKSAATVKSALFKGLHRFGQVVPTASDSILVYDGEDERTQNGIQILRWPHLASALAQRFDPAARPPP